MDKLLKATHLESNFNFKKIQWPFDLIRGTFELKVHVLGSDNNFRWGSQNVWVSHRQHILSQFTIKSLLDHFFFFWPGVAEMRLWTFHTFLLKNMHFIHVSFRVLFLEFYCMHAWKLLRSQRCCLPSEMRHWLLTFFFNRRKYRSQNTNVFAELDAETVTSVDCDGMIFDPTTFKAVREVSCWFKVTWHHLNALYTHTFETNGARAGYKRETERAWESERESCFCWHLLWFLYWAKD